MIAGIFRYDRAIAGADANRLIGEQHMFGVEIRVE